MTITREDQYKGCLLGLAVGDAVGTTVEFSRPGTFKPVSDMVGGGPFNLKPGQWTDDTSMALCLAQSLIECKGFDARDQMDRYVCWWRGGYMSSTGTCFDIGSTTSAALSKYQRSGEPFAGSTNLRSAGNGSLMRLAPVPMFYANNICSMAEQMSGESSRTTHGAEEAVDACRLYGVMISKALTDRGKNVILQAPPHLNSYCATIQAVAEGSYKRKNPPDIVGSGYVVQSLEAALWAFYRSDNFKDGCLMAVNLGNDADTTAAIYGQLAGAYYGVNGIPAEWLAKLHAKGTISDMAIQLMEHGDSLWK